MSRKSDIVFLIFVSSIVYPKYNPYCFILYMLQAFCETEKQKVTYKLRVVSRKVLNYLLKPDTRLLDLNNTVFVNTNVLSPKTQFCVIITQDQDTLVRRKVHVINTKLKSGDILISPTLMHNLKNAKICKLKEYREVNTEFADEVEISLINSQNDWSHFIIDNVLKSYFKTPKLVYTGDIIEISLMEFGESIFFSNCKIKDINENIYFVCNKMISKNRIVNTGFFCVFNETTLKQTSNVRSFIPSIHENQLYDQSLCPNGMENYFRAMQKAVAPFITKNNSK